MADHNTRCSSPFLSCSSNVTSFLCAAFQVPRQGWSPSARQTTDTSSDCVSFGAPLANMLHMFRGSLTAGAILFFFCPAAQPPNPKRFIDRSRRFQPLLTYSLTVSTSCLTRHLEPCSDATLRSLRTKGKNRISIAATRLVQKGSFLASSIHYVHTK